MADLIPHWSRYRNEHADVHSKLEELARLLFESGGTLPDSGELGDEWIRQAVAVGALAVDGDKVAFAEADTRDEYLSHYVAARASEEWDDPDRVVDLLTATDRLAIRTDSSRDLGALVLRLLHERHNRDLLAFITDLARSGEAKRHQFWSLYSDFCKALPEIDVEAGTLAERLCDIAEATAGDLAGGFVYEAVEKLAGRSATVAEALVTEFVNRSGSPAISFAPSALVGLYRFDADKAHQRALDLTRADEADVRRAGVAALGRFSYEEDADSLLAVTKERLVELRSSPDPKTDYVLIRAHSDLLDRAPDLKKGLKELTERKDPSSRHEAARALMAWKDRETLERWWLTGIKNLACTPTTEARTLGLLDHALATAAESHPDVAISFFEHFVSERSEEALLEIDVSELLPMTSRNLHTSGKAGLQAAVTRWFLSAEYRLHWLAHHFVQAHSDPRNSDQEDDLILDPAELRPLDEDAIIHALKRIMGWIVGGRPLAALLVSALERPPEDPDSDSIGEFLAHELSDFVLYNYPGDAGDFIREKADENEGTRAGRVLQKALEESEKYYHALRGLPQLQELRPPARRLHLIGLSHAKMQSKIIEEARRKSAIMDLVHRVPLKYGRGFFSRHEEGGFSTTVTLTSFSHEMDIPRGALINPVGMAFHRVMLRHGGFVDDGGGSGEPR